MTRDQLQAQLDYCQFLVTRIVYDKVRSREIYVYMADLHAQLNKLGE